METRRCGHPTPHGSSIERFRMPRQARSRPRTYRTTYRVGQNQRCAQPTARAPMSSQPLADSIDTSSQSSTDDLAMLGDFGRGTKEQTSSRTKHASNASGHIGHVAEGMFAGALREYSDWVEPTMGPDEPHPHLWLMLATNHPQLYMFSQGWSIWPTCWSAFAILVNAAILVAHISPELVNRSSCSTTVGHRLGSYGARRGRRGELPGTCGEQLFGNIRVRLLSLPLPIWAMCLPKVANN